jgi:hypothetical protein
VQCPEASDELPGDIDDELEIVPPGTGTFEEMDFGEVHEIVDAIGIRWTAHTGDVNRQEDTPNFRAGKSLSKNPGRWLLTRGLWLL